MRIWPRRRPEKDKSRLGDRAPRYTDYLGGLKIPRHSIRPGENVFRLCDSTQNRALPSRTYANGPRHRLACPDRTMVNVQVARSDLTLHRISSACTVVGRTKASSGQTSINRSQVRFATRTYAASTTAAEGLSILRMLDAPIAVFSGAISSEANRKLAIMIVVCTGCLRRLRSYCLEVKTLQR